jgi:hypothetical protein
VIDDYNRPLVTDPFFCGERVYEFEMIRFERTLAEHEFLKGYHTGRTDKNGEAIVDQTKIKNTFNDYPQTPTPSQLLKFEECDESS